MHKKYKKINYGTALDYQIDRAVLKQEWLLASDLSMLLYLGSAMQENYTSLYINNHKAEILKKRGDL